MLCVYGVGGNFPGHLDLGLGGLLLPLMDEMFNLLQRLDLAWIVTDEFPLLLDKCFKCLCGNVIVGGIQQSRTRDLHLFRMLPTLGLC